MRRYDPRVAERDRLWQLFTALVDAGVYCRLAAVASVSGEPWYRIDVPPGNIDLDGLRELVKLADAHGVDVRSDSQGWLEITILAP